MEEMQRAYIVHCSGSLVGTDSHDLLICRPSELEECLNDAAWNHHNEWYDSDDWGDDDGIEPECHSGAHAREYTPATMEDLDCKRSGGGSFLSEHGVLEVWQALGYSRPAFKGDSAFDAWKYIMHFNIPVCQAGASWQMLENWQRQIAACKDVLRALNSVRLDMAKDRPTILEAQLKGVYTMAENEAKCIEANVQKVIARLKAL